ncbi:MAG: hypothetical protein J6S82_04210 [Bacteroidales bacterium]|nr:hypothetical protein [Bacteroidales bacterium]
MNRHLVLLMALWLLAASVQADDSLPIIEVGPDRTVIYPQRMDLTGEESLMDVLQMMPDLMVAGYEDVIDSYNLRIDNTPMNGDMRLILSQMKAKDIAKIQVCDNTGVAKGTIGTAKVLDINMQMPDTVKGIAEGQGGFGEKVEANATVNVLYGSRKTDLYANATYRYMEGHMEYLTLHMTNRFDERNKLLTYFTHMFTGIPEASSQKVMGRARYFHTFNEQGTELLVLGGYQYSTEPLSSTQFPLYVLELNTPLVPSKRLTMMAGAEGDFLITRQKESDRSWDVFNNDIYLQFAYSLPRWQFMVGNRVMFYNYRLMDADTAQTYFDIRNNTSASVIFSPTRRHQIQAGYYRKYYNPTYISLFMQANILVDAVWAMAKRQLDECDINQFKLAYAYTEQKLTVQTEASYYLVEDQPDFAELNASAYWRTKWLTLTGGANLNITKDNTFASVRVVPTVWLPRDWQIGLQVVYYTKNAPQRVAYGTPVYLCLSVNKVIKQRWNIGVDWHDVADAVCSEATMNRHAVNVKLQYRF